MKVFDFDNTLYRGESSVDFALFMIRYNPRIILWLPKIFWNLLKYKLCLIRQKNIEAQIDRFLQSCLPDPDTVHRLVREFWKHHRHRLNAGLLRIIRKDDAIITTGPSFLLYPIQKQLGTSNLLCSEVDLSGKRVMHLNFGSRKVQRYRAKFGSAALHVFYTDSYNDRALMDIAESVYLVRKSSVMRIK